MKELLSIVLGTGVGWILGASVALGTLHLSGAWPSQGFVDAMGNTFILGFPGILIFMVALILSLKEEMVVQ